MTTDINLTRFNQASLAKLGWKILTSSYNWCVQLVINKYLRYHNFFEVHPKPNNFSTWKGILASRYILLKKMRWI